MGVRPCGRSKTSWTSSWIRGGTCGHPVARQMLGCGQRFKPDWLLFLPCISFLFDSWIQVAYEAFWVSFIWHKNTSRLFSLCIMVLYKVSASRIHASSSCSGHRGEYCCLIYSKKKAALFYKENPICLQLWSGSSSSAQIYRTDRLKRHQVETRLREGTRSSWPTATIVYLTLFFLAGEKKWWDLQSGIG